MLRPERSPTRRHDLVRTISAPPDRPSRTDGEPHSVRPTPSTRRRQSFFRGPPGPARSSHGPPRSGPAANQRGRPSAQPTEGGRLRRGTDWTTRPPGAPPSPPALLTENPHEHNERCATLARSRGLPPVQARPGPTAGSHNVIMSTGFCRDKPPSRPWSKTPQPPTTNHRRGGLPARLAPLARAGNRQPEKPSTQEASAAYASSRRPMGGYAAPGARLHGPPPLRTPPRPTSKTSAGGPNPSASRCSPCLSRWRSQAKPA